MATSAEDTATTWVEISAAAAAETAAATLEDPGQQLQRTASAHSTTNTANTLEVVKAGASSTANIPPSRVREKPRPVSELREQHDRPIQKQLPSSRNRY